jgi:hypothetical protein
MSRLDRLKEQHPDLNVSLIDIITSLDPSNSYKYTEFLIKNFKNNNEDYSPNLDEFKTYLGIHFFGHVGISVLNEFERHSKANRIKEKDISKYSDFSELEKQVEIADEIENRKKFEKEILRIYEDDTWLILTPLSFEASKIYGSNTKWCTTQKKYWDEYLRTYRVIYVINKETDIKFAFSKKFSTKKIQAWDSLDNEVDPMVIGNIPDELFLKIRKELQENKTTGDLIGWNDSAKGDLEVVGHRDYDMVRRAISIISLGDYHNPCLESLLSQ